MTFEDESCIKPSKFRRYYNENKKNISAVQTRSRTPSWLPCKNGIHRRQGRSCFPQEKGPRTSDSCRLSRALASVITLRKRPDFVRVNKTGEKAYFKGFLVLRAKQVKECPEPYRIGITVTKKTLGKANVRNRVRRRLKEAVRQSFIKNAEAGYDYVFIGRKEAVDMPFDILLKDMGKVFKN